MRKSPKATKPKRDTSIKLVDKSLLEIREKNFPAITFTSILPVFLKKILHLRFVLIRNKKILHGVHEKQSASKKMQDNYKAKKRFACRSNILIFRAASTTNLSLYRVRLDAAAAIAAIRVIFHIPLHLSKLPCALH